jgi:hypothetical protein
MNFRKHKLVRAPPADQIHWLGAGGAAYLGRLYWTREKRNIKKPRPAERFGGQSNMHPLHSRLRLVRKYFSNRSADGAEATIALEKISNILACVWRLLWLMGRSL